MPGVTERIQRSWSSISASRRVLLMEVKIRERNAWVLPELPMPFHPIPDALLQDFTQVQPSQSLLSLYNFLLFISSSLLPGQCTQLFFRSISLGWFLCVCKLEAHSITSMIGHAETRAFLSRTVESNVTNTTKQHKKSTFKPPQTKSKWASVWVVHREEKFNEKRQAPAALSCEKCYKNLWSLE